METAAWKWIAQEKRMERWVFDPTKSLNEVAMTLPLGVYTTMRTYARWKFFRPDVHLKRLLESASMSGSEIHINNTEFREILRVAIKESDLIPSKSESFKIRIHLDTSQSAGDFYIFIEDLEIPTLAEQTHGCVVLTRVMRRENPRMKSSGFLSIAEPMRKQMPTGVNEVLMVGEDTTLLEGLSSNFFAVQSGEIWTAGEGVLAGITRELVIHTCEELGIPIHFSGISMTRLAILDEAFLTSTSRGVLPIRKVDDQVIGRACPGTQTAIIREAFERHIMEEIEEL